MCRHSKPDETSDTATSVFNRATRAVTDRPGDQLDRMDEVTRQFRYLMNDLFKRSVTSQDFRESQFVQVHETGGGFVYVEIPDLGVRLDQPTVQQVLWQLELLSTPEENRLFIEYKN